MSWKFGVLDKDSGVKKALEEMEADYMRILEAQNQEELVEEADVPADSGELGEREPEEEDMER